MHVLPLKQSASLIKKKRSDAIASVESALEMRAQSLTSMKIPTLWDYAGITRMAAKDFSLTRR